MLDTSISAGQQVDMAHRLVTKREAEKTMLLLSFPDRIESGVECFSVNVYSRITASSGFYLPLEYAIHSNSTPGIYSFHFQWVFPEAEIEIPPNPRRRLSS